MPIGWPMLVPAAGGPCGTIADWSREVMSWYLRHRCRRPATGPHRSGAGLESRPGRPYRAFVRIAGWESRPRYRPGPTRAQRANRRASWRRGARSCDLMGASSAAGVVSQYEQRMGRGRQRTDGLKLWSWNPPLSPLPHPLFPPYTLLLAKESGWVGLAGA